MEFVRSDLLDLSSFKDITPNRSKHNRALLGFIGLLNIKGNIHLGFITKSTRVASPRINENIFAIVEVSFYCLDSDEYDNSMNPNDEEAHLTEDREAYQQIPSLSVKRLLQLGHFYYSDDFDITSNLQERGISDLNNHRISADTPYFRRFMWNSFMISEFIDFRDRLTLIEKTCFDSARFMTLITRGYAKTTNINLNDDDEALLTLISKQSCAKKGPLFGDWGCDDDGAVSNFAESEVIIYSKKFCFAYVIVRGNVPSFWELQSTFSKKSFISKSSKKLILTRSFEAAQHAFRKHFDTLGNQFGDVHVLDCLLREQSNYRGQLKVNYQEHLKAYWNSRESNQERTFDEEKDPHGATDFYLTATDIPVLTTFMKKKGYSATNPSEIASPLLESIVNFGALFYDFESETYVGKQLGIFRVNSFDCLDKANFVCKIISQEVIELAFRDMGILVDGQTRLLHAKLWEENNEVLKYLTQNYLSTCTSIPTKKSTKRSTLKALFAKQYLNVVGEIKPNEMAMRKLLGKLPDQQAVKIFNPLHRYLSSEMTKRANDFSYKKDIKIFASTFNVNGETCKDEDLAPWIFPRVRDGERDYDIVFLGFQEVVELTPGKMMNVRSDNLLTWEARLKKVLEDSGPSKASYVSLWSGQMGGLALLIFIKSDHVPQISNVESAVRKTGLGGMSANKGGMALSLQYQNTRFCFVCSHLAAGLNNLDERHQDYKAISKGISFSKNRKIKDHDAVIWVGDLNYRISMSNETVKALIQQKNFAKLFEFDQLNDQMSKGESFPFFDEMEIAFPPTYKFDNHTNTYDTSDKQRIPAWTDRILSLSRAKILRQEAYSSCEGLLFSDHRPVYAVFVASVTMINESIKKKVSHEIYEGYKKVVGGLDYLLTGADVQKFVAEVSDCGIPPPSSDASKWWLEGGLQAKITIRELLSVDSLDEMLINPGTSSNPFNNTREQEFVRQSTLVKSLY